MPNWKAPRKDGVQGHWLKTLTSMRPHIEVQLNHILDGERTLLDWGTFGKTVLSKKIRQNKVQLITVDQYPACP